VCRTRPDTIFSPTTCQLCPTRQQRRFRTGHSVNSKPRCGARLDAGLPIERILIGSSWGLRLPDEKFTAPAPSGNRPEGNTQTQRKRGPSPYEQTRKRTCKRLRRAVSGAVRPTRSQEGWVGTRTRKTNVPGTTPGGGAPARAQKTPSLARPRRRGRGAGSRRRPGPRAPPQFRPASASLNNSLHCVKDIAALAWTPGCHQDGE